VTANLRTIQPITLGLVIDGDDVRLALPIIWPLVW
jgi:hypothetical protein